jgi:Protein of unknown function (DUF3830)
MGKTIVMEILPSGARAEAELEIDLAPKSCALVWERLPVEANLVHGRYSGPELFIEPGDWPGAPPENQMHFPLPGDVGYFHVPAGRYAASPAGECEIVFVYDYGAEFRGPEGQPVWVNRFARIGTEDAGLFLEAAGRVRRDGGARLRIERGKSD